MILVCVNLVAAGCAAGKGGVSLPANLPGGWARGALREPPPESAPPEIRSLSVRSSIEAEYHGPQPMKVTVYAMGSPTAAFEAAQKWRHREGAVAFQEGRFLAVVDAPRASKAQRDAAADALAESLRSAG